MMRAGNRLGEYHRGIQGLYRDMETCFTAMMENEMDTSMEDEVESGILQWFTSYLDTQNV